MTAQMAILNKKAIAIASDSAVTIKNHDSIKIYTTVNKLFKMSKYEPIGIMVYGNADFMDTPWEVIIKQYRKQLGSYKFKTLTLYAEDFLKYISKSGIISEKSKENAIMLRCYSIFKQILSGVNLKIEEKLSINTKITEKEAIALFREELKLNEKFFKNYNFAENFNSGDINYISKKYSNGFIEVLNNVFENFPLSASDINKLLRIAKTVFTKNIFPESLTAGVVIAGFGEADLFPSFIEYNFDLVVNKKIKYRLLNIKNIDDQTSAIIKPFAQSEMVHLFIGGIDPAYQEYLSNTLESIFNKMPEEIVKIIPKLKENEKKELVQKMLNANQASYKELMNNNEEYKTQYHSDPILETVASLPYIELAEMAESLVNLTSFKRRMSQDAETVAGPIDVALITKGDGFVWIKRKHYFKPELNHHFFNQYDK